MAETATRASAFTRLAATDPPTSRALAVAECQGRALVTVGGAVANPGFVAALRAVLGAELPRQPGGIAAAGHGWTLWLGPAEWLYVAPARDGWALERELARALAPVGGHAVDVSHGRAVLRLSGPPVREVLAAGCPIDLHPRGLPAGSCAQTLFGKINVLVHALADGTAFELYVGRSYADALADGLIAAARDHGIVIAAPVA
jgi:sarcosine oxidase subunit gamma